MDKYIFSEKRMTPEQKKTLKVLDSLAATEDTEIIERRLIEEGYFNASNDDRTKKASLVDITKAEVGETKWHENKTFAYNFSMHCEVVGCEGFEFVWLHVVKDNGKGVGLPFIERIFARKC